MQGSLIIENAKVSLHAIVFHCGFILVASYKRLDLLLFYSLLFICILKLP